MELLILPTLLVSFFLLFHSLGYLLRQVKGFNPQKVNQDIPFDFACVITAYKNGEITIPLIQSLLSQNYAQFHVYVVADRCEKIAFENEKVRIIYPEESLNSKVKSLKVAVANFVRNHDSVVVIDADNVLDVSYLMFINEQFNAGFKVVQGKRTAKNSNTDIAKLDGMGELYYDFNTREIPFQLGASATIAGSGMAVDTGLFIQYLNLEALDENLGKVVTAEDKVLQKFVVEQGLRIAYQPLAVIYDEKTETASKIKRQRTRWFNAYFRHVLESFTLFKKADFNRIYFGFLSIYPPMVLLVSATFLLMLLNYFLWSTGFIVLTISLLVFMFHFIHSLMLRGVKVTQLYALLSLPVFMVNQVLGLIQIKKANKDFLATEHVTSPTV